MTMRSALIFVSMLFASVVPAQDAPQVVVRTSLSAPSVMIGETVRLDVDILTNTFFIAAPEVPELSIAGVIVRLSEGRQVHLNETVNGTSMFGVQRTYELTPIAVADFEIPAFDVVAHPGPGSQSVTSTTRVLSMQVTAPPGAEDAFVTHGLAIEQRFDTDPTKLKVGDAFTQTIEVTATGTPGMFIPDIAPAEIEGLSAYPQTPLIKDTDPSEALVGKRIFAISYVVQEAGDYELPAVSIPWWNIETKKASTANLPSTPVHAIAAPPPPAPFAVPEDPVVDAAPTKRIAWKQIAIWSGVAVALALLGRWLGPHVMRWMREIAARRRVHRERYLDSEAFAYTQLREALGSGTPGEVTAALYRWIDRLPAPASATGHRLAAVGDEDFSRACQELLDLRYNHATATNTSEVIARIRERLAIARHCALRPKPRRHSHVRSLPDMNPA